MNQRQELTERYEDALLALLLDEAAEAEGQNLLTLNEQLKADPAAAVPDDLEEKCLQTISKVFHREKKKAVRRRSLRVLRTAAVAALIAVLLLGTVIAVSPSFRRQALNTIIDTFDQCSEIRFEPKSKVYPKADAGSVDLSGILDQYSILESNYGKLSTYIQLQGRNGEIVYILIDTISENLVYNYDTENCSEESVTVQGWDATLYRKQSEEDPEISLLWIDENKGYITMMWSPSVSAEELVRIAESIVLN